MPIPPHLQKLNPEQRRAAGTTEGPLLVLAGAGSGKTRMLVHRIAHLLYLGVQPRRIVAVTFTNRAASEMRERVAAIGGQSVRGITLSTFHSLGARLLREHGETVGLPPSFSIYPAGDQLALVKRIMSEEVHVAATAGDDRYDPRRVHQQISGWKNRLLSPREARQEVIEGKMKHNRDDDYDVLAADVYPRYEDSLRAAGACDFDDLLLLPVRLLSESAEAREAVWRRWHYVMVDEYQDTNGAQLEMARLLAGPRKNLCVVGDDDQSIYAWRGADLRNILDFERHYPGAQTVILEENYRSTQRILGAANSVIAGNSDRKPKQMRTSNGPGPLIGRWEFGDQTTPGEEQEAEMVAREISLRRFHEKLDWGDFAVLYRTNLQARPIEEALRASNIPYRVIGGTSYFDRKEIADAVAYFRVVLNPRDEISLRRIINYPTRGIGRTTVFRLLEAAREQGTRLWETIDAAELPASLSPARQAAVREFAALINELRESLERTRAAISEGVRDISLRAWADEALLSIALEDAIRAENKSDRGAEARVDNLRDFLDALGRFENRAWAELPLPDEEAEWQPPSLTAFLERVSLVEDAERSAEDAGEAAGNQVILMTLHSAKGLEFSHVFIVGLEEEILPHGRSVADAGKGGPDPIAEERRLFYVGLTRARHRLTLSGCRTRRRGKEITVRLPSRFLNEIPAELMDLRTGDSQSSLSAEDSAELKVNFFSQMREMLEDS